MSKFKKLLSQSSSGQSLSGQSSSGSPSESSSSPKSSLDQGPDPRLIGVETDSLEPRRSEPKNPAPDLPKTLTQSSGLPAPKKLSPQAYVATPGIPASLDLKAMELKAVELKPNPSSEADYIKVSIYLQRQTHRAVKQALLEDPEASVAELSDLIEGLLTQWLGSRF